MEDSGIDSDSKHDFCISSQLQESVNASYSFNENAKYHAFVVNSGHNHKSSEPNQLVGPRPNEILKPLTHGVIETIENSRTYCETTLAKNHPKLMSTNQLQKRLERQIQEARKFRQQPKNDISESQKSSLIPRNRLPVPNKASNLFVVTKADEQPLVSWESESEEDFDFHPISRLSEQEISNQSESFNVDSTPEDEDLDLIPPKPFNQRCSCCFANVSCIII